MASKFWVGGTGTWDSTTTTHWSLTTGGSAGAAAPVTGDTVTFDGSSGGGTVTVDSTINGLSLVSITAGAFTGTLDFSVNNPSMTFTSGVTGFSLSGSGSGRVFKLGSGTFTMANGSFDLTTTTGMGASTFNACTLVFSATTNTAAQGINGGGQTYNVITVSPRASVSTSGFSIGTQSNTIGTLNFTGPISVTQATGTTQTITNLNITGSGANFVNFASYNTSGTFAYNVTTSATITNCILKGMNFAGSSIAINATNSIDMGNNSLNGGSITPPSGGGSTGGGIIGS